MGVTGKEEKKSLKFHGPFIFNLDENLVTFVNESMS